MAATHLALLRGVNIGRAKRVPMAELRAIVESLGYGGVRTLLNSGNVLFEAPGVAPAEAGARIERGLLDRLGISSRVTVLTAAELAAAVAENPLADPDRDPSRLHVAVLADPADRAKLQTLLAADWTPEALALGTRSAFLWTPGGTIDSRLVAAVGRALGEAVTSRNWATMSKLAALAGETAGQ